MLTNDQKEAIVIEMLNAKRPIREIAREAQKSFSDIVEIKEKLTVGEGQKNIILENRKISSRSSTQSPINMPINTLEINS